MCTNCNEITIPVGPTGAAGTNGTNGTNGVKGDTGLTGANGQNGTNGKVILSTYNSITGTNIPGNTEETAFTYTVLANELANNGDELELYAYYEYYQNDPAYLRIKFGAKTHTITVQDAEDDIRILKIIISRISATSQLWTISETYYINSTSVSETILAVESSTVTLTGANTFEITIQDTAGGNHLILKKATLYKNAI